MIKCFSFCVCALDLEGFLAKTSLWSGPAWQIRLATQLARYSWQIDFLDNARKHCILWIHMKTGKNRWLPAKEDIGKACILSLGLQKIPCRSRTMTSWPSEKSSPLSFIFERLRRIFSCAQLHYSSLQHPHFSRSHQTDIAFLLPIQQLAHRLEDFRGISCWFCNVKCNVKCDVRVVLCVVVPNPVGKLDKCRRVSTRVPNVEVLSFCHLGSSLHVATEVLSTWARDTSDFRLVGWCGAYGTVVVAGISDTSYCTFYLILYPLSPFSMSYRHRHLLIRTLIRWWWELYET